MGPKAMFCELVQLQIRRERNVRNAAVQLPNPVSADWPDAIAGVPGSYFHPEWFPIPKSHQRETVCRLHHSTRLFAHCIDRPIQNPTDTFVLHSQMKSAGAYKHQYAEHGVGDDEFAEAFARVEDVLATYRAL